MASGLQVFRDVINYRVGCNRVLSGLSYRNYRMALGLKMTVALFGV